jgi:hypothetical protein
MKRIVSMARGKNSLRRLKPRGIGAAGQRQGRARLKRMCGE